MTRENDDACAEDPSAVIPGREQRSRARNPYAAAVVMDSGLAGLRPRPGMTVEHAG